MTRTTTDLAEWLGRHGLGQYAQTFAENNIEYSVLSDLTEDDLIKIGISSLGHRKKLLRAIEALTAARQPAGNNRAFRRCCGATLSGATSRSRIPSDHGDVQ